LRVNADAAWKIGMLAYMLLAPTLCSAATDSTFNREATESGFEKMMTGKSSEGKVWLNLIPWETGMRGVVYSDNNYAISRKGGCSKAYLVNNYQNQSIWDTNEKAKYTAHTMDGLFKRYVLEVPIDDNRVEFEAKVFWAQVGLNNSQSQLLCNGWLQPPQTKDFINSVSRFEAGSKQTKSYLFTEHFDGFEKHFGYEKIVVGINQLSFLEIAFSTTSQKYQYFLTMLKGLLDGNLSIVTDLLAPVYDTAEEVAEKWKEELKASSSTNILKDMDRLIAEMLNRKRRRRKRPKRMNTVISYQNFQQTTHHLGTWAKSKVDKQLREFGEGPDDSANQEDPGKKPKRKNLVKPQMSQFSSTYKDKPDTSDVPAEEVEHDDSAAKRRIERLHRCQTVGSADGLTQDAQSSASSEKERSEKGTITSMP